MTHRLITFWRLSGSGNSIFLSRRPGRRRAGSSVSARFVAMITLIRNPYTVFQDLVHDNFGQSKTVGGYLAFTLTDWSNPSIWVSNSIRIRWTSRSAPVLGRDIFMSHHLVVESKLDGASGASLVLASNRRVAIASTLSIKIIAGEFSLASWKTSRTILGPSPRYFWTNSDPTTAMKAADVWWATAFEPFST